jgi:hypothetical protein
MDRSTIIAIAAFAAAASMVGACVFYNCKKKKNSLADTDLDLSPSG